MTLSELIKSATANETQSSAQLDSSINLITNQGAKSSKETSEEKRCFYCKRTDHFIRNCPEVKKHVCQNCGRKGHTENRCYTARKQRPYGRPSKQFAKSFPKPYRQKSSRINYVAEDNENADDDEQEYVFFMEGLDKVDCVIGGVKSRLIVDSGAASNIISVATWESMKANKIKVLSNDANCSKMFRAYGAEDPIPVKGTFDAEIEWDGNKQMARFYVLKKATNLSSA